ncbi:MAG: lysophospholipid acyltransferase family protein [Dongiaceae bacterium]
MTGKPISAPTSAATSDRPAALLRWLFFFLIVRPAVLVLLGLNLRHRERLTKQGPAILVANHNSHLDTPVLMSLFPQRLLPRLRPVAAVDYFLKDARRAWFACNIMGIIPLERRPEGGADPLLPLERALDRGDILILFPEGTRGEPEKMTALKSGIAHLARRRPDVPVVPIFIHGLGKALPKGEALLVPFFVDIFVGERVIWTGERARFMEDLAARFEELAREAPPPDWR